MGMRGDVVNEEVVLDINEMLKGWLFETSLKVGFQKQKQRESTEI
jgi:hypothetical protein